MMEKNAASRGLAAEILGMGHFAVFGASDREDDVGCRIVNRLKKAGYKAYPINPRIAEIGSMRCYGTLDELPVVPQVIVVALPPEPALEVIKSGVAHGVRRFWIQPEAGSDDVLTYVSENGLSVVHSQCLHDELGKRS